LHKLSKPNQRKQSTVFRYALLHYKPRLLRALGEKMKHIVGFFDSKEEYRSQKLEKAHRLCFDTNDDRTYAYISLIAPVFDKYAQQQAGIGINSINVLFLLTETEYSNVLFELNLLKSKFNTFPKSWNEYTGTKKIGKEPEIIVQPIIFQNTVLKIIATLESFIELAKSTQKNIVYGNGVCYRPLSGKKPSSGTVTYS
jgi:hypothetical protein